MAKAKKMVKTEQNKPKTRVLDVKTEQTPRKQGELYQVGNCKPPKDRQFGQPNGNPRHNGAWKKEDNARFKLEQMIKLSDRELDYLLQDEDAPEFDKKLALAIKMGEWKELEGMINQVYGYPKQAVDTTILTPPAPLSPRKQK